MRLSKIDLTNLVAIGHDDDYLELIIDRGHELEHVTIPAPIEAYEGLQQLDAVIASEPPLFSAALEHPQLPGQTQLNHRQPVQSSMARAVDYDPRQNRLQVEFKSGAVYEYADVDAETWNALQESNSVGKFFNQEIKGNYQFRRI
ncbi:MAG: KTSC domain-containing protein [Cyanothece sp. SIO1E1]|nr:KTSC domain-containing protein [Cyanothece sp. SIO1E1]